MQKVRKIFTLFPSPTKHATLRVIFELQSPSPMQKIACFAVGVVLLCIVGCNDVKKLRTLAEQGNADAQFQLGGRYCTGKGVPSDAVESIKWFRAAAEQGHAEAQGALASRYYYGIEGLLPEDKEEAAKWMRKSAEGGHGMGQLRLGDFYDKGEGVAEDKEEAVKWFRKAAEQEGPGQYSAMWRLGRCYYEGTGVPQDTAEAVKWLRKAEAGFKTQTTNLSGGNPATDLLQEIEAKK